MKRCEKIKPIWVQMAIVLTAILLFTSAALAQTAAPPLKAKIVFRDLDGDLIYNLDNPGEKITVDIILQNTTAAPIWTLKGFGNFHTYLFFYGPLGEDAKLITSASSQLGGSPTPSVAPDEVLVEQLDADWASGAAKTILTEARDVYNLTFPGQYKVWFAMSFVQYDSTRIVTEDRNNDGIDEHYAPYEAAIFRDVIEYREEYITLTTNAPAAVISDVRVTVTEYIFGDGSRPGVTKKPFVDPAFILRLYQRSACEEIFSPINHKTCGAIVNDPPLTANAQTAKLIDAERGEYLFRNVRQDDYVLIGHATTTTDYKHLWSPIDAADPAWGADEISKNLKIMTDHRGKKSPGKSWKITGSELLIIEPEYVEWTSDQELYPFAFESSGDWGVEVAVEPPEGFVPDTDKLTENVSSELKALQFTITDVGSKYEATKVKYKLKHKGKSQKIDSKIYIKLARKLAKEKKVPVWGEDEEESRLPKKEK